MLFWIAAIAISVLVIGVIAFSLVRKASVAASSDVAFYKDQLEEIERDVVRGVLGADEAELTRVEVGRRLLEADKAELAASGVGEAPKWATALALGGIACFVIGGGAWLYWQIGAPGYPDLPINLRIEMAKELRASRPNQAEFETTAEFPVPEVDPEYIALVEKLRAVVMAEDDQDEQIEEINPERKIEGLRLLAQYEASLGNFIAAYQAQTTLIELKDAAATSEDFSALAHFMVLAAGGYVSPEAEAALNNALQRDPKDQPARYYSGLLFFQTGRPDLAFRIWANLLDESPPDAPWVPPIRAQIEEVALLAGQNDYRLPPQRGPTAADMEAAADMTAEDRQAMIQGMVTQLANRLATEGGPASDWAKLIRAYGVLGQAETARPIFEEAQTAFANDPVGLAEIKAAAQDVGLID